MKIEQAIEFDRVLKEALEKAIRDFGEGIVLERRLIGILKDLLAFSSCQPAELIIRIMIESNSMRRFLDAKTRSGKELEGFLFRETDTHAHQFGFAEAWLEIVFRTVLAGLGCTNLPAARATKNGTLNTLAADHSVCTSPTSSASMDPLDIRNIHKGKNYLEMQKDLCAAAKGTIMTDYVNEDRSFALFSCHYGPFRNVEVKVVSNNAYKTADYIGITLLSRHVRANGIHRRRVHRKTSAVQDTPHLLKEEPTKEESHLINHT